MKSFLFTYFVLLALFAGLTLFLSQTASKLIIDNRQARLSMATTNAQAESIAKAKDQLATLGDTTAWLPNARITEDQIRTRITMHATAVQLTDVTINSQTSEGESNQSSNRIFSIKAQAASTDLLIQFIRNLESDPAHFRTVRSSLTMPSGPTKAALDLTLIGAAQ